MDNELINRPSEEWELYRTEHPLLVLLRDARRINPDQRVSLCRFETDHPCSGMCGECLALERRCLKLEETSR